MVELIEIILYMVISAMILFYVIRVGTCCVFRSFGNEEWRAILKENEDKAYRHFEKWFEILKKMKK